MKETFHVKFWSIDAVRGLSHANSLNSLLDNHALLVLVKVIIMQNSVRISSPTPDSSLQDTYWYPLVSSICRYRHARRSVSW